MSDDVIDIHIQVTVFISLSYRLGRELLGHRRATHLTIFGELPNCFPAWLPWKSSSPPSLMSVLVYHLPDGCDEALVTALTCTDMITSLAIFSCVRWPSVFLFCKNVYSFICFFFFFFFFARGREIASRHVAQTSFKLATIFSLSLLNARVTSKCYHASFCSFFIRFFVFMLLNGRSSLYIMDASLFPAQAQV
jgi:hypothetical protein